MSKAVTINLTETALFNIMVDIAEAISRETTKMARYSHDSFNDFLKPRKYNMGLISPVNNTDIHNISKQQVVRGIAHKIKPSDIEIAQFVELKAKESGFQSQGIKLLPQSTGDVLEFSFELPKEKVKVNLGGEP